MLAVAGLLEGVGRQTINDDGWRMLIGSAVLIGWLTYFYALAGEEGRVVASSALKLRDLKRTFITPEGVDLRLELGSAGSRAAAFLIDLVIMVIVLLAMTFGALYLFSATRTTAARPASPNSSPCSGSSVSSFCATAGSRCSRWAAAALRRVRGCWVCVSSRATVPGSLERR